MRTFLALSMLCLAGCGTSFDGAYEGSYLVSDVQCSDGKSIRAPEGEGGTLSLILRESFNQLEVVGKRQFSKGGKTTELEGLSAASHHCKMLPIESKDSGLISFASASCDPTPSAYGIETGSMLLSNASLAIELHEVFLGTWGEAVTCRYSVTANLVQTRAD